MFRLWKHLLPYEAGDLCVFIRGMGYGNGEPSKEVDCFKYLGSQVTADYGCERDVVH